MIKAEWTSKDSLDLQPTCNQLATDLISRQSAIDAVEKAVFKGVARSAIESLPSVQPPKDVNVTVTFDDKKLREIVDDLIINQGLEQVVHCKYCHHFEPYDEDCERAGMGDCNYFDAEDMKDDDYCSYGERKEQEHD